jgi:hypothetical protein
LKKDNRLAIVSWDSPYDEFHDLSLCYNGLGWTGYSTHEYERNELGQLDGFSTVVIDKLDRFGVVYFSAFTRNGQLINAPDRFSVSSRARSAVENIKEALGIESDATFNEILPSRLLPVSQLQIIYEQPSELSQSEKDEIIQLYQSIRKILVTPDRFSTESTNRQFEGVRHKFSVPPSAVGLPLNPEKLSQTPFTVNAYVFLKP